LDKCPGTAPEKRNWDTKYKEAYSRLFIVIDFWHFIIELPNAVAKGEMIGRNVEWHSRTITKHKSNNNKIIFVFDFCQEFLCTDQSNGIESIDRSIDLCFSLSQ